ncbi:MAG: hypothetical protein ACI87E_004672 [Mariniblastus sp.]|jgi:hypothetical protein
MVSSDFAWFFDLNYQRNSKLWSRYSCAGRHQSLACDGNDIREFRAVPNHTHPMASPEKLDLRVQIQRRCRAKCFKAVNSEPLI